MRLVFPAVFVAALLACASQLAAQPLPQPKDPPPDLSEQAIDAADFDGWKARRDARADADRKAAEAAEQAAKSKSKRRRAASAPAKPPADDAPDPFLIRLQILLDRAHASPGAIDGRDGDNQKKAIRAFAEMRGMPTSDGEPTAEIWAAVSAGQGKATSTYEITDDDLKGRYVGKVPVDYAKLAKLKWIGFADVVEMLAERFHMDEGLLRRLNPGVDFQRAGEKILVADTGAEATGKVARIVIDKKENELRAYGEDGKLILSDPATIGSPDTPSPSGKMKVTKAFPDPHYVYDPKKNFQQGKNRRRLVLPPGPNGPVGSMWIDLTKPTYGIHGTPEPSKISKTASHGCVRLTNWDAGALGALIIPNKTTVEFLDAR